MHYAIVFKAVKMIILYKNVIFLIIFAQNTEHVYTLEPH